MVSVTGSITDCSYGSPETSARARPFLYRPDYDCQTVAAMEANNATVYFLLRLGCYINPFRGVLFTITNKPL